MTRMADKTREDPREQIRRQYAEARWLLARDVDAVLREVQAFSARLGEALGEIDRDEAIRALRRYVIERFDARLPVPVAADVAVLQQLVREAYAHFEEPESPVDIQEWVKTARPLIARGQP